MTSLIFGGGSSNLAGTKVIITNIFKWLLIISLEFLRIKLFLFNLKSFKSAVRYKQFNELFILVDKNLQRWKINNDDTISVNFFFDICLTNLNDGPL